MPVWIRLRLVSVVLLVVSAGIAGAAPRYAAAGVKRVVLRDLGTRPVADEHLPYPAPAQEQDAPSRSGRVGGNQVMQKDPPPPPCEPSWSNFWCYGSRTSSCKANRSCQDAEGECLEQAGQNCYTYVDDAGHDQCASCVPR
jgi:hypothetical protein